MDDTTFGIITGLIIGVVFTLIIGGEWMEENHFEEIEKLGGAICEEEYNMDFESYINDVLECKPFKESYDGLQVKLSQSKTKK